MSDVAAEQVRSARLSWTLRTGVALCFVGHGAFGIMTKSAWVPYFAAVGIPSALAWRLMPVIGTMDVAIAFLAFIRPCRALFAWAAAWTIWTALLRPLAGEGWPEFFERAGNYGVPLAILAAVGWRGAWWCRLPDAWQLTADAWRRVETTLRVALVTLLAGHASCALILNKAGLARLFAVVDAADPDAMMRAVGWGELGLAALVLLVRSPGLAVFAAAWKLASESLFLASGAPAAVFEVIERGGSYVVPLALAIVMLRDAGASPVRAPRPA